MNKEQIQARVASLNPWYHAIDFGDGITTSGWEGITPQWESVRSVRQQIDYAGKTVLDIGTRDGMWAFEAEDLGAKVVVATDVGFNERLYFAKVIKGSNIIPYQNCPAEKLTERLDCLRYQKVVGKFDIIQHLGVLYHLPDQIRSLWECRKNIVDGGMLLLETAYWRNELLQIARLNVDNAVYCDPETFWAQTFSSLADSLKICGFSVYGKQSVVYQNENVGRVCIAAKATHQPFDYPY
jgi:SAM-dependent methyltransferase